jgi:bifunctional UDP-N-acetylglucosamine pyrophosphorylase/glucosamine-1-phosphate N-acetyltransferase
VRIEADVTVYPGVILEGQTRIGKGTVIGPNALLRNTSVGEGVEIKAGTVAEESVIADSVKVGP